MQNDRWIAWFCKSRLPAMKKSFDRFQLNGGAPHPITLDVDPTIDSTIAVDAHTSAARSPLLSVRAVRGLKTRVAFGAMVGAAGLGLWAFSNFTRTPVRPAVVSPPSVAVAMPVQANVADWTDLTGQFSAVNQVVLRAQVSGYLTEIHFKDGQIVHKGDLLFVIDPRPYEIQLEQANAQFQTASATLALANKQLERSARLNRVAVESDEHLDESTQSQRAAAAALKAAEAAIHGAQLNIEFTHIVALDPIYLDFDLSEADYAAYEHSASARPSGANAVQISVDGERPWARDGDLDFLDNEIDRRSGTLHARATLANPDMMIAPGGFARVRVPLSASLPQLLVPDAAVGTDQSSKLVMVVQDDGVVAPKPVEIGPLEDHAMRVITRGLLPTDRVVVQGLMRTRPGMKVEPHLTTVDANTNS
jgi:multidrug efflux system membrane fusion protein